MAPAQIWRRFLVDRADTAALSAVLPLCNFPSRRNADCALIPTTLEWTAVAEERVQRRLAAILAADVADYSRLTESRD
jgi:class 3 adenylate cyclase